MITFNRAKQSLEYEFGKRSFTPEDTYYLGLCANNPTGNSGLGEPSYSTGYRRVAIDNTYNSNAGYAESWNIATNSNGFYVSNRIAFEFPNITAECNTANYWFLCTQQITSTSSDVGTLIYYGALTSPRALPENTQVTVTAGEMKMYRTNPA